MKQYRHGAIKFAGIVSTIYFALITLATVGAIVFSILWMAESQSFLPVLETIQRWISTTLQNILPSDLYGVIEPLAGLILLIASSTILIFDILFLLVGISLIRKGKMHIQMYSARRGKTSFTAFVFILLALIPIPIYLFVAKFLPIFAVSAIFLLCAILIYIDLGKSKGIQGDDVELPIIKETKTPQTASAPMSRLNLKREVNGLPFKEGAKPSTSTVSAPTSPVFVAPPTNVAATPNVISQASSAPQPAPTPAAMSNQQKLINEIAGLDKLRERGEMTNMQYTIARDALVKKYQNNGK